MRIDNEFTVDAPVERVWDLLTDVEAIAPCMPGARLTGVDGDVYSGTVKVKVGPVVAAYQGTAWFAEKDDEARTAVVEASGKASRGAGNAAGSVALELREVDGGTLVTLQTTLKITGKLAQLGSGMIKDVSERLLGEFVKCLEGKLSTTETATEVAVMAHGSAEPGRTGEGSGNNGNDEGDGSHMTGGDHMTGGGHMSGGSHMTGGAHMSGSGALSNESQEDKGGAGSEGPAPGATGGTAGRGDVPGDPASAAGPSTRRSIPGEEVEPLDLGRATGSAAVKRLWPMLALVVVVVGLLVGYAFFT